ncbi:hypothetical protein [Glaesserella parasuis]|uniref:DUF2335 domain-containing protein n=3 Tax=Glaesserella parasuis TaxID=738 RepID=A0A837B0E7_GLAPU|nr:hypothetical protein [Glaesserella parasuis]ACL32761.1 putative inner membrane protein [Glaesserella parasuis SH0165]AIK16369.1 hypothetical protein JL26_00175 [Glaesserella parasuis]KDB44342.1 hypothetical protein HPS9_10870 [Glaesserella parasuis HPS9]MCT8547428.1 hypothetical protein [Glaesserella parasuis]MCT8551705.1 hypothetical protein [Glaesserella parasuis]
MHSENKQEIVEVVTKDPELLAEVINTDAAQTIIVQQAMSLHHGPLPPAREMAEYAKHIPNFGDRVMTYAEQAKNERFELNKTSLKQKSLGLWFGMLSVVIVAGFCFYLVSQGHPGLAATVMISVLATIAGVFVIGKKIEAPKSNNTEENNN